MQLGLEVRDERDGARGDLGTTARLRANFTPARAGLKRMLRAFDGRFTHSSRPWIATEPDDRVWVYADVIREGTGTGLVASAGSWRRSSRVRSSP